MNDVVQTSPAPAPDAAKLESLKQLTMIIYVLYAASLFVGITGIVAIVMNYVKRDDTVGTIYESHFTWQIRTFWWALLWALIVAAVSLLTAVVIIGFAIWPIGMFALGVWAIYRIARGWLLQVEHHAFLAAVAAQEHGRHAALQRGAGVAGRIPGRRLDFDHLGAVVGQHLAGERAEHHGG